VNGQERIVENGHGTVTRQNRKKHCIYPLIKLQSKGENVALFDGEDEKNLFKTEFYN